MHVPIRNTRFLKAAIFATLTVGFCNQLRADSTALKSDLEHTLVGQSVVSKIMFGGTAIPSRTSTNYPVNTLVFPDSSQVSYRVEWGLIREEVSPYRMQRRFDPGTSFRIAGVEVKDDRLELKLQSESGDSANLKLMLGAGWQSRVNAAAVLAQLANIFVFAEQPPPAAATPASTGPTAAQASLSVVSTSEYRRNPSVPRIEGRISDEDLHVIMVEFDDETRRSLAALSQDAVVLSRELNTCQKAYKSQGIYQLQNQLGKAMQPRNVGDVIQMNELVKACVDTAQRGFYDNGGGGCRFNCSHDYSEAQSAMEQLRSPSVRNETKSVDMDVMTERQRREPLELARAAVIHVEQTLDKGDLITANQEYQQLPSDTRSVSVAALQHYLQLTVGFRQDLASYAQVSKFSLHRDLSASEEIQLLAQERNALNASQTKPLTRGLLQSTVSAETGVARQKLDGMTVLQVGETAYSVPQASDDVGLSNLNDRLSLVTNRISDIDGKLQHVGELRQIAAHIDALNAVATVLGPSETASLKQKIDQVAIAERMRASLVQTQQALESRIAEVRAAEEKREAAARAEEERRVAAARAEAAAKLAAAIAQRQNYAEDLTKSMAGEIRWGATGRESEILAGVVTVNRLSDHTYSQLTAGSPLWKEMFSKGFRFRVVLDKNKSLKVAAIKQEGGFSVPITELPDVDRTSLEQAISTLSVGASDGQSTP